MYEMSAGEALSGLFPSEAEYGCVEDERCTNIIQYIFERGHGGQCKHDIKQVSTTMIVLQGLHTCHDIVVADFSSTLCILPCTL